MGTWGGILEGGGGRKGSGGDVFGDEEGVLVHVGWIRLEADGLVRMVVRSYLCASIYLSILHEGG